MTDGERVRAARKAQGLSMERFAARIGISAGAVSQIENGLVNVSGVVCKAICREFGISETWLRTGEGDMYGAIDRQILSWVSDVMEDGGFKQRFVKLLASLPPEQWEALESYALQLAGQNDTAQDNQGGGED